MRGPFARFRQSRSDDRELGTGLWRRAHDRFVRAMDRYWQVLREGMASIWNERTVPFHRTAVPPGQRLMGWLVAEDRRADLARLIAEIDGPGVPLREGRYLHPWIDDPDVPDLLSPA